jgi:D-alanine-D-alanine ligase
MRNKLRVLVLMHEELVPPADLDGLSEQEMVPFRTEYDVLGALRKLGHDARPLGVHDDLGVIREAIQEFHPHITFNVLEEFHGATMYGQAVISFLELMRQAFTGCNPRGLVLAHDKLLTKKILAYHRIPSPRCVFFPCGRKFRAPKRGAYPLIVKSSFEDASLGIAQASVVTNDQQLQDRVALLHEAFGTDAMAEEYIEGRELYLGLLGNGRISTLPIWEMKFNRWPDGAPRIATERVKRNLAYQREHGIETEAADVSPEVRRRVERMGRQVYRVLGLTGYARMDLRLTEDDRAFVIEVNPNPDLAREEDFARSARAAGLGYRQLIEKILRLGLAWRPKWKEQEAQG